MEPAEFHADQLLRTESAARLATSAWDSMATVDDWPQVAKKVALVTIAAQTASAEAAATHARDAIGVGVGKLNPSAFAGGATDVDNLVYRPLDSYLYGAVVHTRSLYGQSSEAEALLAGREWLRTLVRLQVADAARNALGTAIASTPNAHFYRVIQPPCCQRCALLRGETFAWNSAFSRHPRCFPEGVVTSGPALRAATRRWYEGELVLLTTTGGQELPVTGNHPILTSRGWVPANLLNEGDEVVRSTRSQGAGALVVPDHDQVPTLIQDVWRSFSVGLLERMPSSPEDFHGDGQAGKVDVVRPYGALPSHGVTAIGHESGQGLFGRATRLAALLFGQRAAQLVDLGHGPQACCSVCGSGLESTFGGGHHRSPDDPGLTAGAPLDACLFESLCDHVARNAVLGSERVLAGSRQVGGDDRLDRKIYEVPPRWDAPGDPFSLENRAGYASRGKDLLDRLAGQVELDRLVEVRRVGFRGHVYSLDSSEGWHTANSLIVSNCDCMQGPILSEEQARYSHVSTEDITDLTRAQRQAVDDGADLNQVINAQRGITVHRLNDGTQVKLTLDGTTKRSWYGYVQKELARQRGEALKVTTQAVGRRGAVKNYTVSRLKPRLTPEAIYQYSTTREEAVRLLARNGYIVGDLKSVVRLAA